MKGPGMLFVKAAISPSPGNPLTEAEYMRWYDDVHIAEIIHTSGMPNAFRYFHVNKAPGSGRPTPDCPRPYLAFYPMPDVAFLQTSEFRNISVKSDVLPGTGVCYDMADTDVGYYLLVGQTGNGKQGSGSYIAISEIEPAADATDEEVNAFFDQHAETMSKLYNPQYQRSLRFRLFHARTNAQSRVLKGLAPATDAPAPALEPPSWMQIHEFTAEPQADPRSTIENDTHRVIRDARQKETHGYRLMKAHGQKRFFGD